MTRFMRSGLFGWRACCPLIALATASPALATSRTWINPGGGAWNDPINWSPFGAPQSTDDALLTPSGPGSFFCGFDANPTGTFMVTFGTVVVAPTGTGSMT